MAKPKKVGDEQEGVEQPEEVSVMQPPPPKTAPKDMGLVGAIGIIIDGIDSEKADTPARALALKMARTKLQSAQVFLRMDV